jgi:hypothetical protein
MESNLNIHTQAAKVEQMVIDDDRTDFADHRERQHGPHRR